MAISDGTRVKVAVVGLGRFGRLHSLTVAGLAEADLVGVVARRSESVEALQEELPDVPGWIDLEVALSECDAEAWVVASTTASHVPITRRLLEAGKTVLLEKPISEDLELVERNAAPACTTRPTQRGWVRATRAEYYRLPRLELLHVV